MSGQPALLWKHIGWHFIQKHQPLELECYRFTLTHDSARQNEKGSSTKYGDL